MRSLDAVAVSFYDYRCPGALHVVSQIRTTLVIAHRLSSVMQANRILVMRDGGNVEEGNHKQLLDCMVIMKSLTYTQKAESSSEEDQV
ncbi:hypothetical protein [Cohnella sp.]|uniref:hypothetical protein n=1 Tax=Cohnella sp. TaxID=1883426 RepID=UPI0035628142